MQTYKIESVQTTNIYPKLCVRLCTLQQPTKQLKVFPTYFGKSFSFSARHTSCIYCRHRCRHYRHHHHHHHHTTTKIFWVIFTNNSDTQTPNSPSAIDFVHVFEIRILLHAPANIHTHTHTHARFSANEIVRQSNFLTTWQRFFDVTFFGIVQINR